MKRSDSVRALRPTAEQIASARAEVDRRGWQASKAKAHGACPRGVRGSDGKFIPCENCRATTNPGRWPLFFTEGDAAGVVIWTCSTCKNAQTRRGTATVLVEAPESAI